jgi:hypothetical protein
LKFLPYPPVAPRSSRIHAELVHATTNRHGSSQRLDSPHDLIAAMNSMSARMLTLLYLAVYWVLFASSFCLSGVCRALIVLFKWPGSTSRTILIACCFFFLVVFAAVLIYQLYKALTKYRGGYVRMSTLCRRGLVPSGIQSSASFQFAAKFMATDAIQIIIGILFVYFSIAIVVTVTALLLIIVQNLLERIDSDLDVFFVLKWILGKILSFDFLANLYFWNTILIILLSNLFGSSWLSLFRLFRVQHPLVELPKRVASCCCIRLRYVHQFCCH